MRVLIKNEKESLNILKNIYGIDLRRSAFLERVISSYRIITKKSVVKLVCRGNEIIVEYDDHSKFDPSKLIEREDIRNSDIFGGFTKYVYEMIKKEKLKEITYNKINRDRSEVIFKFNYDMGQNDEIEVDIVEHLDIQNIYHYTITDIACEFIKDKKARQLIAEFLINLTQHNFRKHGKYIRMEDLMR